LLLDLSGDEKLLNNLHLPDWVLDRASTAESANGMLKFHNYRVAIALLPELAEDQFEEIEGLLDRDEHLAWVALTQHSALEKQDFRRLIYEHFYDYFSLPLGGTLEHLKNALGHLEGMSRLRDMEEESLLPVTEFQMVGGSKQFLAIFDQIRSSEHQARSDVPADDEGADPGNRHEPRPAGEQDRPGPGELRRAKGRDAEECEPDDGRQAADREPGIGERLHRTSSGDRAFADGQQAEQSEDPRGDAERRKAECRPDESGECPGLEGAQDRQRDQQQDQADQERCDEDPGVERERPGERCDYDEREDG
jgi:hypothetical protein